MPITWQTNFLRVNNVSTTAVLQLQQVMAQEREFANWNMTGATGCKRVVAEKPRQPEAHGW
jgi:hypothetical protein